MGKKLVLALQALAIVSLLLNAELGTRLVRRLAGTDTGIKNVFTSVNNILKVPPSPRPSTVNVPLYLALCQELIRQDTIPRDFPFHAFKVVEEDQDVCIDWTSPHMSLLEMFASAMIAVHLPDIKYSHNCGHTRKATHYSPWLNFTTVQQAIGAIPIQQHPEVMTVDTLKQQCRRCLVSYDEEVEVSRIKSSGYHHCFAWPEQSNTDQGSGANDKPNVEAGLATIGSALDAIRESLYKVALEWMDSAKPPLEEQSGIVYWLDPTSIALELDDVLAEITNIASVTSISILAGPACTNAYLPTGQACHEYGEALAKNLSSLFPDMRENGFQSEDGITFKIATSTAAALSRMTLARVLICPPRSPSCLFPAVTMPLHGSKAVVLDDGASMKAVEFFAAVGYVGNSTVKVMDASKIPATNVVRTHEGTPDPFINNEGYPEGVKRPTIPSDETVNALSPQQLLETNRAASADLRGLRYDLFDSWQNEEDWNKHKLLFTIPKRNGDLPTVDAVGCNDASTLHLKNDNGEHEDLVADYNMQVRYRDMVHKERDPGVLTLPANKHAYMVFHEVLQSVPTMPTNVQMSIWNDEESFHFEPHIIAPDSATIYDQYPMVDLPDGDYVTYTAHWPGNYGHFLHDHLPSIAYARHVMPESTKFILVKNESDRKRLQFIDPIFEAERVVWAEERTIYRVSTGSMTGLPPSKTRHIIDRFNQLRNWVLPKPSFATDQKTIIYYTRGGKDTHHGRTMDPDHEKLLLQLIRDKMAEHGRKEHLVVFDGQENGSTMSLEHQFDLFRSATIAIGPHGSGLANILWLPAADSCDHRSKVLEFLVQPNQTDIQVGGSYKTYMYLFGFPQWVDYHHLYYSSDSTPDRLHVDLDQFLEALDDLFRGETNAGPSRLLSPPLTTSTSR